MPMCGRAKDGGAPKPIFPVAERKGNAPTLYPMYLMSWDVLMSLTCFTAHQVLKAHGRLTEWSPALLGRVLLVSHEWLGHAHPDPDGEQLLALRGALHALVSHQADVQSDWKQQVLAGNRERLSGRRLAAVLPACYFWMDYASMPQECKDHDSKGMQDAVASIPAYVERSAILLVLAPACRHQDVPARVCSYPSWRGRGWCRAELCAALLARTRVRPLRVLSAGAVPEFISACDALYLPPGEGAFTCCARGHIVDGRTIECDRPAVASLVAGMLEAAAEHLESAGDAMRRRVLLCNTDRFLRGFTRAPIAARKLTVEGFQEWMQWSQDEEVASEYGYVPSLQHWAALAGNAPVLRVLRQHKPWLLHNKPPIGAPELGIAIGSLPLHLAAFAADGRASALQLLLSGRADPLLRDARGCTAAACAARQGTLEQVQCWFAQEPEWDVSRPEGGRGATMLAVAATQSGPGAAAVLRLLLERRADARAGAGGAAPRDAALLAACAGDGADPEAVAVLLAAGCSPNARFEPPWRTTRAAFCAMRLAARWSALRGRTPGPVVVALAEGVGATPLHFAAWSGDVATVRLLLQAKADPTLVNSMGRTPVELARRRFGGRAPDLLEAAMASGGCTAVSALDPRVPPGGVASEVARVWI